MIRLSVVTPEKLVTSGLYDQVSVSTTTGLITVREKHQPLVSAIGSGQLETEKSGLKELFSVHSGIVLVRPHQNGVTEVSVLLESSEPVTTLDEERAKESVTRAKQAMIELEGIEDLAAYALLESTIERELNHIRLVQKLKK